MHFIWWWLFCYLPSRLWKQKKQSVQKGPWFFEIWLIGPDDANPSILIYYKTSINSLDKMRYLSEFQIELNLIHLKINPFSFLPPTLDCGITVNPWINVATRTFEENNKHSPLKKHIPLHQITEFLTFFMDYSL